MIQEGLFNKLVNDAGVTAILPAGNAKNCVHFGKAPKQPPTPFVVIHLVDIPPAEGTLQGVTDLIDGSIQFDCYSDDAGNGALIARQLCAAVRNVFLPPGGTPFSGTLSDGTTISFCDVLADFDDNYEVGGVGYLYRSVVRMKAFYLEGPNTI